ncbi:peptidase, partial [Bacillus cereus]
MKRMHNVFTVKNQTDSSADLYIYGDIINNTAWKWDDSDVMPDDVKNMLGQLDDKSNLN